MGHTLDIRYCRSRSPGRGWYSPSCHGGLKKGGGLDRQWIDGVLKRCFLQGEGCSCCKEPGCDQIHLDSQKLARLGWAVLAGLVMAPYSTFYNPLHRPQPSGPALACLVKTELFSLGGKCSIFMREEIVKRQGKNL